MSRIIITTNKRKIVIEDEELVGVVEEKLSEEQKLVIEALESWFWNEIKKKELIYSIKHNWISIMYNNITGSSGTCKGNPKLICAFNYKEYIEEVGGKPVVVIGFMKHITRHLLYRLVEKNQEYNIINNKN